MIGSYAAKCQGKPKPRLSNRNEPAAVWQGTGYLKVIHIRCWNVLQHLKFKAGNLEHTASVLYWAEQFKADWNLLRPTSFGSEVRLHNILTVWLACWGVDVLAFPPGLAAPSSSNCRSVSTPTPKEPAWALRRTGITFHVSSIDAKSVNNNNNPDLRLEASLAGLWAGPGKTPFESSSVLQSRTTLPWKRLQYSWPLAWL